MEPAPYNPRVTLKPGDPAYDRLKASLETFDYVDPIIVNRRTGRIVGGHQRYAVLRDLGYTEAAVSVVDLDETREQALNVALNKNTGAWDEEKLADLLTELTTTLDDITVTGFGADEVDAFLASMQPRPQEDPDAAIPEPPREPVTQLGDLWQLGQHRLLCGDGTDPECLRLVLGEGVAALLVTSPPYNQKLDQFKPSGMHREGDWVAKVGRLAYADSLPEPEYQAQQVRALAAWYDVLADGASAFYNHKHRYRNKQVISPLQWLPGPFRWRQEIVWSRPGSVTQNARMFLPSDERIYWLYKGDEFFFDDRTDVKSWSIVWELRMEVNKVHAAAFPTDLPRRCIAACSRPGDVVLEPYAGSGTTLVVAEEMGRVCAAIEADPAYCDVILQRWEALTGQKAVKIDGGPTQ